jgi:hypothetical protein
MLHSFMKFELLIKLEMKTALGEADIHIHESKGSAVNEHKLIIGNECRHW